MAPGARAAIAMTRPHKTCSLAPPTVTPTAATRCDRLTSTSAVHGQRRCDGVHDQNALSHSEMLVAQSAAQWGITFSFVEERPHPFLGDCLLKFGVGIFAAT